MLIKGITTGNSHLSQAVQVFNTLNNHLVAEERRRNFKYEDFASHSIKFGEELLTAAAFNSDSEIRDSLARTAKTLCNASLSVIIALDANVDVAEAREAWGKILAASVQVLKQVISLAAKKG